MQEQAIWDSTGICCLDVGVGGEEPVHQFIQFERGTTYDVMNCLPTLKEAFYLVEIGMDALNVATPVGLPKSSRAGLPRKPHPPLTIILPKPRRYLLNPSKIDLESPLSR